VFWATIVVGETLAIAAVVERVNVRQPT